MAPKGERPAAAAAATSGHQPAGGPTRRVTRQTGMLAPSSTSTMTRPQSRDNLAGGGSGVRRAATTRRSSGSSSGGGGNSSSSSRDGRGGGRRRDLVAPEITYHVPQPGRRPGSSLVRPHGPLGGPPGGLVRAGRTSRPAGPTRQQRAQARPDRNIDKVVLGNLCFRTWYPSHYGKEVLGDGGSKPSAAAGSAGKERTAMQQHQHPAAAQEAPPMLERLYVCPSCFKYAKELVAWRGHVRLCERRRRVPGQKIYIHPRGRRQTAVAHDGRPVGGKRRRRDGGVRYVEELVQDEGEWSIWEVDGEKDELFCQNLSLFAKLFLDNKSVFFDVSGFKYYLLVYTAPAAPPWDSDATAPPQITGFFSKEKMSWDNNNLACILVFPPWQRKGLGALLMGASYEMSRREGILGGPEKPISDLGKRGYLRFWRGEIARWLLGRAAGDETAGEARQPTAVAVDVDDVSRGTWIAPDDCLAVLREMDLVDDAGPGPGKPASAPESCGLAGADDAAHAAAGGDQTPPLQPVRRVCLDLQALRRFVAAHGIGLDRACDPRGFVGEVAAAEPEAEAGGHER